ncbi:hypothetical protein LuPra_02743 [Luteitalea pratensis]|uniref:Uncharacterized protein n=1 Tax=Luteitalea pratensis TaxID=1855912 RepID=A0A143PM63_LUTPR|nr:hypothetical protein LuPra_02743 [Luteitalea pratensis]
MPHPYPVALRERAVRTALTRIRSSRSALRSVSRRCCSGYSGPVPPASSRGVGAWLDLEMHSPNPELVTSDCGRRWPAKRGHPIQDAAGQARIEFSAPTTAGPKTVANDGLVAEDSVLHAGLPVVAGGLLPLPPPERFHVADRAIARARARSAARHLRRPGRRHDHPRVARARGLIEGDRVVGRVRRDAGDPTGRRANQVNAHGRVIGRRLGQRVRDDHSGAVDTQMQLLPASRATSAMFRCGPLAFPPSLKDRAVDDQMQRSLRREVTHCDVQPLTPSRERLLVRGIETRAHHGQDRPDEALRLA